MVKDYMRGVVENGSGKKANLEGYEVGGKTGTAEKLPRDNGKYLVSFIGYAPQENPEVVVYVVIDEVNDYDQAQSSYAVQMAADIMKEIFPYLGITTVEGYEPTTDDASTADSTSTDTAAESTTTDSTSTGTAYTNGTSGSSDSPYEGYELASDGYYYGNDGYYDKYGNFYTY